MPKKYKFLFLFIVVFILTSFTFAFAAKSVDELKKQMQQRSDSIKQIEKEINKKQSKVDEEIEKRNNLDLKISAMLDDIEDVEAVIDEKQNEIDAKQAEIDEITDKIEEKDEMLKNRLKIMYEYGTSSYMELLLDSDGLTDLLKRISVVKSVYNYDKNVINEYAESKQTLEEAKQLVISEQNEQKEAKSILENKKSDLEGLKSEKQKIIDSLNNDIEALEKEEQKKEDDYNALKKELEAAMSSSTSTASYSGNGEFCWPSASSKRITSKYGYRVHPITGKNKLHRGIDIGAGLGTDVLAAESGTVVTAGWNNSYGYYITINHGGGYVTLYAHNSKLLVSKGQKVKRGEVIAKCGSTGNSTGPHIHFEVMLNGQLQNPMNYF